MVCGIETTDILHFVLLVYSNILTIGDGGFYWILLGENIYTNLSAQSSRKKSLHCLINEAQTCKYNLKISNDWAAIKYHTFYAWKFLELSSQDERMLPTILLQNLRIYESKKPIVAEFYSSSSLLRWQCDTVWQWECAISGWALTRAVTCKLCPMSHVTWYRDMMTLDDTHLAHTSPRSSLHWCDWGDWGLRWA